MTSTVFSHNRVELASVVQVTALLFAKQIDVFIRFMRNYKIKVFFLINSIGLVVFDVFVLGGSDT